MRGPQCSRHPSRWEAETAQNAQLTYAAAAAAADADASEAQQCSAMTSLDSAPCNHKPVIF